MTRHVPPLTSRSLVEVLDALASTTPVPAGGSAAALAGAAGVSLLLMAATLPKTRSGAAAETMELAAAAVRLRPLRSDLVGLVDRDAEAYAALIDAFRKPKEASPDQRQRVEDIAAATRTATEVPLEMMRAGRQALEAAIPVASHCSRVVSADVNVAVELLVAAVRGAGGSVDANLATLKDAAYVERIATERRQLEMESLGDADRARRQL